MAPKKAKEKEKFIAVQKDCDNILFSTIERSYPHESDTKKRFFDSLKEAEELVSEAIEDESNGFDSDEGDVVIYKVTPVKIAKTQRVHFVNA